MASLPRARRVLLIEDEPGLVLTLTDRLTSEGYEVSAASDGISGLERATRESWDVILLDVMLPGANGFDVCRDLRQRGITTPIIMGLFENQVPVDSITIMVQKEVADRMQVGPGTKDYGALSLAVQYYAKPKIVANVPPNCFMPRPKVGSAVIRLERYEKPPVEVKNEKLMFRIIRASFNQRRKTLVNGLKNSQEIPFSKEQIEQALGMCGLSLSVRGEALTLAQFAQLANAFTEIS